MKLKDWDYLQMQHISWSLVLLLSWNHGTLHPPQKHKLRAKFCIGSLCGSVLNTIAMWSPILKPVDFNKNEPVWVITDGSQTGISAMYGQGTNWDQQDFYQRNSQAHSTITICTNTRHLRSWKLSWNGGINFWAESLQWSQTTKALNTSRPNQPCHRGRQGGGNIFPASIIIPSM